MVTTNGSKKRNSDEEDFETMRQYILACPLLPKDNAAMKAAIKGLEDELKRRDRDTKLQKKFSSSTASAAAKAPHDPQSSLQDIDNEEWQDVGEDRKEKINRGESPEGEEVEFLDMEGDTSFLGRRLAEVAIASLGENHPKSKTPLSAIAVVLHAALVSPAVGFVCTGTAHDKDQAKAKSGFAAPIRDLAKNQFLPKDWERYASNPTDAQQQVVLRYRKNGSVLLRVEICGEEATESPSKEISIKLLPANSSETPSGALVFPMEEYINLDSWMAALKASSGSAGLEPAIHYKALPVLMTAFAKTFDLGSIKDEDDNNQESDAPAAAFIGVHSTENCSAEALKRNKEFAKPIFVDNGQARSGYDDRPTIDNSFPQRPMFIGDFSGDLVPGGTSSLDPLRRMGPGHGGNLMGPNHPMFAGGGGMGGVGDGSGFGMRPRFDPFGPPGGPQEIRPQGGPGGRPLPPHMRPRGSGNPNPDHLPPPNSLGGNMFC